MRRWVREHLRLLDFPAHQPLPRQPSRVGPENSETGRRCWSAWKDGAAIPRQCARLPGEPAAQNISRRSELSRQIGESSFDRDARAEIIGRAAGTEDYDNVGVVERFEPPPDAPVDPGCIIAIANFRGGLRHRRDALEVTQRALGI